MSRVFFSACSLLTNCGKCKLSYSSNVCFNVCSRHLSKFSKQQRFLKPPLESEDLNVSGRKLQEKLVASFVSGCINLNPSDVDNLKEEVYSKGEHLSPTNFDSVFLENCIQLKNFPLGKSYFEMISQPDILNKIGVIGKFFRLCYFFKNELTDEDKERIVCLFDRLLEKYEVLDSTSCENALLALSVTDQWKRGFDLLKMSFTSSPPSGNMYSSLSEAALLNNEYNVAWQLMETCIENGRRVNPRVYRTILTLFEDNPNEGLEKVLMFMERHNIHPENDLAELISEVYSRTVKNGKKPAFTKISLRGQCGGCQKKLQPLKINASDFEYLRNAFLDPVLIGNDIFIKTKPEEFKAFKNFLQKSGRFDVILDGLNVAYAIPNRVTTPQTSSLLLKQVVEHFVTQNKKVLVFGRFHMNKWPSRNMDYIRKNSSLFLVDNLTADDPFLLYAAMCSGPRTTFVSRDQMRSHKFLLKDEKLRRIFTKWQQMNQYELKHVSKDGFVTFREPLSYLKDVQKSESGAWHLPVTFPDDKKAGLSPHASARNMTWLCLP